jgi:hypothetical protein
MNASIQRAFPAFSVGFALSYALFFVAADQNLFNHNALAVYYPALGRFTWDKLTAPFGQTGPAMLWYGWIGNAILVGLVAGAISLFVPIRARFWSILTWTAPILAFLVLCWFERIWFIR